MQKKSEFEFSSFAAQCLIFVRICTMAHKGHAANKKETTQTKKKTRKQNRNHANKKETTQTKKKTQTKKQKPRTQNRNHANKTETAHTKQKPRKQNRNHAHKTETTQTKKKTQTKKQKPRTQNRNHANKTETTHTKQKPRKQKRNSFPEPLRIFCVVSLTKVIAVGESVTRVVWSTVRGVFDEEFRRCSAHAVGQN